MSLTFYKSKVICLSSVLLSVILLLGCGEKKPDGLPKLFPVSITLQQEGKPLDGASVVLIATGQQDWATTGTTDANGLATMMTRGKYFGAPEGSYKVTVQKTRTTSNITPPKFNSPGEQKQWESEHAKELNQSKTYDYVEPIYSDMKNTPLEITVKQEPLTVQLNCGKPIKKEVKYTGPGK